MGNFTLAERLQQMKAEDVISDPQVRDQFILVYNKIWREGGEAAYERESIYFNQQLAGEALKKCTAQSVYFAFIDLAVRGLSLQPGSQAQCYLLPRNVAAGIDQQRRTIWERQCVLTISGYGELVLRTRAGQIRYADNPVIVYEGDFFQTGEKDGRKFVNYSANVPRTSNKIIACYIKIVRADGNYDYSVMTQADWLRLADYSAKNNAKYDPNTRQRINGNPNELYNSNGGQIDTGFLIAKCVKHAFKSYPKIPIGAGTAFASDLEDSKQPDFDPYGGVDPAQAPTPTPAPTPEPVVPDFAPARDLSGGVTVPPEDDDDGAF